MDISSFSRCLKDLIVEYDKVGVPFIGYFISEMAPAKYSFSRTMIYPPGRNLSFREHITTLKDCDMLVDRVSREDGVPKLQAARELRELCEVMCRDLEQGGRCVLPGVGVLEIGKDGGIDFKAEEGLDIFPEGVALEPVFIKEINGAAVSSEGAIATPASQARNDEEMVVEAMVDMSCDDGEVDDVAADAAADDDVVADAAADVVAGDEVVDDVEGAIATPASQARNDEEMVVEAMVDVPCDDGDVDDVAADAAADDDVVADAAADDDVVADAAADVVAGDEVVDDVEGAIATPASQSRNGRRIVLWCVVGVVAAAILFLVAMYVFKEQFAPLSERIISSIDALLDSLLYSDEDLRLLGK